MVPSILNDDDDDEAEGSEDEDRGRHITSYAGELLAAGIDALLDDRDRVDPWQITGRVLQSVERVLPRRTVKIVPTQYAMCSEAWELEVEEDGQWSEVLAWGVFTDRIVSHLGGDPAARFFVPDLTNKKLIMLTAVNTEASGNQAAVTDVQLLVLGYD